MQRRAWVDQIIRRRMVMIVTMAIVMMRMTKMVMIMVRYWVQRRAWVQKIIRRRRDG